VLNAARERRFEVDTLNAALARSNKDLDDFAHIASHDLKEPLQSLLLNCRFLAEDFQHRIGPDGHTRLAALVRQAERMGDLIDSLLQFSRFSRAREPRSVSPCSPADSRKLHREPELRAAPPPVCRILNRAGGISARTSPGNAE